MAYYKPLKKIYLDLLVFAAGFAVLGRLYRFPYLYLLTGLAVLCALHPKTAAALSYGWQKLGKALGWLNSRILLTVFFFVFVTPFSLLYRLLRKKRPAGGWVASDPRGTDFNKPY